MTTEMSKIRKLLAQLVIETASSSLRFYLTGGQICGHILAMKKSVNIYIQERQKCSTSDFLFVLLETQYVCMNIINSN
jgi:predicted nucleic acid-binding Zn finger protein